MLPERAAGNEVGRMAGMRAVQRWSSVSEKQRRLRIFDPPPRFLHANR
jgi:hypothetical protein